MTPKQDELNNPPYYVLAIKSFKEYAVEFGSFDRSEIIEELDHWITQAEHKSVTWDILKTVNNQKEIKKELDFLNAHGYPKGSIRNQSNWARRDQLTGSAKPATEEKQKSKFVKNTKNDGFGDRDAFSKAAIKAVKEAAHTRKKSGALISEADLVSGAVAVMQLVDVQCFGADPDHLQIMPASWLFGIMRGESINGGSLPANKVLIETWTEQDPDYEESYKCRSITAPEHINVIELDLDEIKEEFDGEDLELELEAISEIKQSIRG